MKAKKMSAMIMSTNVGMMLKRISYWLVSWQGFYRTRKSTYLEGAIDGCTSVQNPQHLPGLAVHVKRQRKIQEVIESELGHS